MTHHPARSVPEPEGGDGGWRDPKLLRSLCLSFPSSSSSSSAGAERQTQTRRDRPFFAAGTEGRAYWASSPSRRGTAVRHESSSVPAACSLASEMQRLRGEVSSRCRRVAVGVAPMGKMAAGFRGDRSVRRCRTVTPGIGKGPCGDLGIPLFVAGPAVAEGTRGKGMRKWEADSLTPMSRL